MRRLIIEMNLNEMKKFEDNPIFQKIRSLEILQFLKEGPDEVAIVCRVEFNDPSARMEDFIDADILELQTLDREEGGAYTYFIKSRSGALHSTAGGYLSVPFEIRNGRARMTYLGNGKQIKFFLEEIERVGIKYRVSSVMDAKFPQHSPLSRLTEKQRKVLTTAYVLGYYDTPRRISSQELGKRLKIGSSTLVGHRRRAERRLLAEIMGA